MKTKVQLNMTAMAEATPLTSDAKSSPIIIWKMNHKIKIFIVGQNFLKSYPWNWSETKWEANDEQNHAAQRYDWNISHIWTTLFQAEIYAQHDQTQAHDDARLKKKNSSTGFLN